jgi:choline dehydrogenase
VRTNSIDTEIAFLSTVAGGGVLSKNKQQESEFYLQSAAASNYARPLKANYDYIVCGSGSSGSVVARRLAEDERTSVLLIEAGVSDVSDTVAIASKWPLNLGSERSWNYKSEPNANLNGRTLAIDAGKTLGGGSSINVMTWARGHQSDWDYFASEVNDPAWNYDAIQKIYCRIEDWNGVADPGVRGQRGPVYIEPARNPNPIAEALLEAAHEKGFPIFSGHNGQMMKVPEGASLLESCLRGDQRQSIYRSYVYPLTDRPNLSVAPQTKVVRILFEGTRAVGVELIRGGQTSEVFADREIVLSLGAIQTPRVLMQSGIGDKAELELHRIPVVEHVPGVGKNYQDHVAMDVTWEYKEPQQPRNSMCEALVFARSNQALLSPDIQGVCVEVPLSSPENATRYKLPGAGWGFFGGNVRPNSRGQLKLTGPKYDDKIEIHGNDLSHPEDMRVALASIELFRELGNSKPMQRFSKREVMPGPLRGAEMETYVRNAARTFYHQSCTAKMGLDEMSVVDASLRVHGVSNLRIADGSVLPRITTGNTMAPCVVVGERASDLIRMQ